jgi:hypothetical protein
VLSIRNCQVSVRFVRFVSLLLKPLRVRILSVANLLNEMSNYIMLSIKITCIKYVWMIYYKD